MTEDLTQFTSRAQVKAARAEAARLIVTEGLSKAQNQIHSR